MGFIPTTASNSFRFDHDSARPIGRLGHRPEFELPALVDTKAPVARFEAATKLSHPLVTITPAELVGRKATPLGRLTAELVQSSSHDRLTMQFNAPVHMLVLHEQGERRDGETIVQGAARSTLRDVARKFSFVPAGHEYREWHDPRTLAARLTYFYIDPQELAADCALDELVLEPRLFFEDPALLATAMKLKTALESPAPENALYLDALAVVLLHELFRVFRGTRSSQPLARGGLAAWQERTVTAYIESHLAESISLGALAKLVRLSPHYFCRAFKQSFGVPPHRYHVERRIEHAKGLLAKRTQSVTEIGLVVGYGETSSFTAAFRKVTGMTPTAYQRSLS